MPVFAEPAANRVSRYYRITARNRVATKAGAEATADSAVKTPTGRGRKQPCRSRFLSSNPDPGLGHAKVKLSLVLADQKRQIQIGV